MEGTDIQEKLMASIMRRQGEIKRPMFATTNIEDEESDQN
mgnify:CR=1 FL=1